MTPHDMAVVIAGVLTADVIEFIFWYVYVKFIVTTSGTDEE